MAGDGGGWERTAACRDGPAARGPVLRGSEAALGAAGRRVVSPVLVGRAGELSLLLSVVSTPPAVAAVEGEAGIGKTRLISELRSRPEMADRIVVSGFCRRLREPFPLGPLVEVITGLGGRLEAANLSPVTGVLRTLVPELDTVLPPPPPPLDDSRAEQHRMFRALVEVFGAVGPAVMVLEDMHWADEQTLDFVGYLVSDPPPTLGLVLSYRGQEVAAGVRALTANLSPATSRAHLTLASLDAEQTGALVSAIVGTGEVSREFAGYLRDRTDGIPFAIEEVIALLRERGAVVKRKGVWSRRTLDQLPVPNGVRDLVLERVDRLAPPARRLLNAAAVLQEPAPEAVVVAMSGHTNASGVCALTMAIGAGLLMERGGVIGFRHVLSAQAVYEQVPGPQRRELHSRAADELGRLGPPPLGQVAFHLRHAGRLLEWADAAERAAEQAIELGNDGEATRLLEGVLREAPLDPVRRGRLAVKLGRAAGEATRAGTVIDLLSEILQEEIPRALRGEVRHLLAMLLEESGSDLEMWRRLDREAVDELEDRPDLQAWAMVGLGIPADPTVPVSQHRDWLRRALQRLPAISEPSMQVLLLGKIAMANAQLGDPRWRDLTDQLVDRTSGPPQHRRETNAQWSVAFAACCLGHHEVAHQLLSRLEEMAADPSRRLSLSVRSTAILLSYCRGRWAGLPTEIESLDRELDDFAPARLDVEVVAGCLELAVGRLDNAQRRLTDVLVQLERRPSYDLLPIPAAALIRLFLARHEIDDAVAAAHRFLALVERKGIWAPAGRVLPALAQALLAGDRAGEARRLVDRCAVEFRHLDTPVAPAALAYAKGVLLAADQDHAAAADLLVGAADLYDDAQCPYEAAQAREQAARSLFTVTDARAEPNLRGALTEYQRLGAKWDYARVASLARDHGVGLPARHRGGTRGYGNALSPREHEVVVLAATGRTNKEIARDLFLSANTVKQHLRVAMRKLGVHTRAALAHRVAVASEEQK